MDRYRLRILLCLLALVVLAVSAGCSGPRGTGGIAALASPGPTQNPTPAATPPASVTRSPSITPQMPATIAALPATAPVATATRPSAAAPSPTSTPTPTPGPTPDGIARTVHAPILMYHYVSEPPPDADIYRRDLSVTPAQLDAHLAYLEDAGYHVVTLDDLLYALTLGRPLPEKPVMLTFDDGYEDNYTNAFPILKKHGMSATFFIVTDWVNENRPGYMTWPQIEEMAAAGQRFGSHTRDHPNLAGRSVDYLVWQALGSKEAIEEHLGYHPRWVAYPLGKYDEQTIAVFASAHYWGGLTSSQGATHTLANVFELKRVRVRGSHSAQDLAALLELQW